MTTKLHWNDIPPFTRKSNYQGDVDWDHVVRTVEDFTKEENLDFNPDYQRDHVWTEAQQRAFVEFGLRGGRSGMDIYLNCPRWMSGKHGRMEVVDGKQRLTAVMAFCSDKLRVFPQWVKGGALCSEFQGSKRLMDGRFRFHINNLETRAEVIRWYLEMNSGGTPHTEAELNRVSALLGEALDLNSYGEAE